MGDNTLSVAVDDNIIPDTHHNGLVEALLIDLVPRNASRVATSDAGQIGSSLYRWLRGYFGELRVGISTDNLRVHSPNANEIWIENNFGDSVRLIEDTVEMYIDGVLKLKVDADGLDGSLIKLLSIDYGSIAAKNVEEGGPANGSVGGSLNSLASNEITAPLISGKTYIFSYRAQNLQTSDTLRMNVDPPSTAEVEIEGLQFSVTRGTEGGMFYYETTYTPTESGNFVFKIYGRNWTDVTNGYAVVKEA